MAILVVVAVIYHKIKKVVGPVEMKELTKAAKDFKNIEQQEYSRQKSVGGITRLLEPVIIKDFGDFNKDFLFSKVEKDLSRIFTAIEEKDANILKDDKDLIYMYHTVKDQINDIKGQGFNVRYDDLKFHAHAIKDYNKSEGRATITLSSTMEYYYYNDSVKNKKIDYNNIKKQTRYTTQYVYVYDETKFKHNDKSFSIRCPNCGAPLQKLGAGNCMYCGTYIEPINLRNWFMVSYKEDY